VKRFIGTVDKSLSITVFRYTITVHILSFILIGFFGSDRILHRAAEQILDVMM
jgi:hypothetical protein